MTEQIRIGVVGCGNVMDGAYMPLIAKLRLAGKPVEVVAACHTKHDRCRELLHKWKIPNFTEDYRELVRSGDVDLVLVLTSMRDHARIASAALEAGKGVLVEKPMATSLREAAELVDQARRNRGYLVCAPFVILSPTFQAISARVADGEIGRVCLGRGRYGWSGPDWAAWFYRQGGGCIFDLAVYNLTSLTGLIGPAVRVMGMTGTAVPQRMIRSESVRVEAEDNVQILLDFGEARFASITSGFTMQRYRSPALELYGDEGTIQMLGDDWAPEGHEMWRNEVGAWQVFEETDRLWSWADGLRHLVECYERNEQPIVAPEHAYHVLEIMLAAQASGRDGRAREIESTFTPPDFRRKLKPEISRDRVHDRRRE